MRSDVKTTSWSTFFFALLGLLWCGYVAFPTANPAPCASSGCELFRDTTVGGISLWWVGGAYFFLLSILCLRGNRALVRFLAWSALFLDTILLLVMFMTAPCFDCLVVASFIGLAFYSARPKASDNGWFAEESLRPSLLLPIWFGLFLGNLVVMGNERLPLYTLGKAVNKDVRVFFSPSCPACRGAVHTFGDSAVLYPVMESDEDFDSILRFGALVKTGVPAASAIDRCLNPVEPLPDIAFYERLVLQAQLTRNKAALFKQGFRALPLIQINGLPGYRGHAVDHAPPPVAGGSAPAFGFSEQSRQPAGGPETVPDFLLDTENMGRCGGDNPIPCD